MNVKLCVTALLCLVLTYLLSFTPIHGQALRVGDAIPDELWDLPLQVVNHPSGKQSITLSEYKDKLIILDFWATWCGACIKKFPEIGKLQEEFEDQLQFVGIANDSKDKIDEFIGRYRARDKSRFIPLSIMTTRAVENSFSYKSIPHYVWIDKGGRIKAITYAADVIRENIQKFIANSDFQYTLKEDLKDFKISEPLFVHGNGGEMPSTNVYRSLLTGRVEGLNMSLTILNVMSDKPVNKVTGINCDIARLFTIAYPEASRYPASRVILEVDKPEKLRFSGLKDDYFTWSKENTFTYEQNFPPTLAKNAVDFVAQDFYRYWGLVGFFEEREINCIVIKTNEAVSKVYTKGGEPHNNLKTTGEDRFLFNYTLKTLTSYLNDNQESIFYIDESDCKEKLDLSFPEDIQNISKLSEILLEQGIVLHPQRRKVKVFVITEKPSNHE